MQAVMLQVVSAHFKNLLYVFPFKNYGNHKSVDLIMSLT